MQLITHGRPGPGIRELQASDITALDDYMQRCKLGPWRPGIARSLALVARRPWREGLGQEMVSAPTEGQRQRAARELQAMRAKTRAELKKLHRIQDRMLRNEAESE